MGWVAGRLCMLLRRPATQLGGQQQPYTSSGRATTLTPMLRQVPIRLFTTDSTGASGVSCGAGQEQGRSTEWAM